LGKFEDLLGTVNDSDGPVGVRNSDVSGAEPALCIEALFGNLLLLEVALEDVRSQHLDFTSRVRLVRGEVVHIWNVSESKLVAFDWASDMAQVRVCDIGTGGGS